MLGFNVLLLAFGLVVADILETQSPPEWSPVYTVKGVIHIPFSDLHEPFQAWFDSTQNKSRIDYYDGMLMTLQFPPVASDGNWTLINIVPETTESELNVLGCRVDSNEHIHIQPALPDLTNYQYVGSEKLLGTDTVKWELVKNNENSTEEHAMWVHYEVDKNGTSMAVPMKYEVTERDHVRGVFSDHIYIEYSDYNIGKKLLSKDIFDIFHDITEPCVLDQYVLNPINQYVHYHAKHHEEVFEDFKLSYNRHYESEEEHEKRMRIFRDNLRFIESHNRARLGFTLAVNHLADYTDEELGMLRGRVQNDEPDFNEGLSFPYSQDEIKELLGEIPEEFDWRLHGAVTSVKNQGSCGSCWSFSAVGAAEGAAFLHTKQLVRFSEQALVDCSWGFGNAGCGGGGSHAAYEWIMKHGLPTDEAYGGYLAMDGYCHMENVTAATTIKNWVNVPSFNEDALKLAVFKRGPIAVSINASPKSFSFYKNGIYFDPKCNNQKEDLNHGVLVVGYGTFNGTNYWIVKNSWANSWGNDGYIFMASKDNNCGVETEPTYVLI